jgi:hypothetical protein
MSAWSPSGPGVGNDLELATLIAFPVGDITLPGLVSAAADRRHPDRRPVVARAIFPGTERPLALSVIDSMRHLHIIGAHRGRRGALLPGALSLDPPCR